MSETAITKKSSVALAVAEESGYSRNEIELVKTTVAKGTTDDQLALFLCTAKRMGLDPMAKQIHAVVRKTKDGPQMTIQVSIDGYRAIADRTGRLAGIDDAVYDDETKDHPNKATVTIHKIVGNMVVNYTSTARWSEYVQVNYEGKIGPMWKKMPFLMLAKCAEALALRKAFPADLSGVYTFEEMSQDDGSQVPIQMPSPSRQEKHPETDHSESVQPEENASVVEPEYVEEPTSLEPTVGRKSSVGTAEEKPKVLPPQEDAVITDKQRRLFFSICKNFKLQEGEMRDVVMKVCGVESTTKIPASKFQSLLDEVDPERQYHK